MPIPGTVPTVKPIFSVPFSILSSCLGKPNLEICNEI